MSEVELPVVDKRRTILEEIHNGWMDEEVAVKSICLFAQPPILTD